MTSIVKLSNHLTLEEARRLKELGFKERVSSYYEDETIKSAHLESGWDFNSSFKNCVSRPTYHQALAWFHDALQLDALEVGIEVNSEHLKLERYKTFNEAKIATQRYLFDKLCEIAEQKPKRG